MRREGELFVEALLSSEGQAVRHAFFAVRTAQKISEFSSTAVMMAKEAVNYAHESGLSDGMLFERRLFHSLFATEDQKEGMSAFAEKRKAQFKNR